KSVNLGDRAVAWIESEVDEWMESIIDRRWI
ncbi:AlpA family phage regulatory protein, partial [Vibrio parahaemolyticus]